MRVFFPSRALSSAQRDPLDCDRVCDILIETADRHEPARLEELLNYLSPEAEAHIATCSANVPSWRHEILDPPSCFAIASVIVESVQMTG